jgi:hypothetical protein
MVELNHSPPNVPYRSIFGRFFERYGTFDAYLDSLVPAHRPISRLGAWPLSLMLFAQVAHR